MKSSYCPRFCCRSRRSYLVGGMAIMLSSGCHTGGVRPTYQTIPKDVRRNTVQAQAANEAGLRAVETGDLEQAERLFRDALQYDLYYSPAHNNLGLVLLERSGHYEAAWEFDCAAGLTPYAVEPKANLGLLYEGIGRIDRAIDEYESALRIEASNATIMRHLARAHVKARSDDQVVKTFLEKLFLIPNDQQWDRWVRGQLLRVGRSGEESQSFQLQPAD